MTGNRKLLKNFKKNGINGLLFIKINIFVLENKKYKVGFVFVPGKISNVPGFHFHLMNQLKALGFF